jgi:hypothetical protein
VPHELVDWAEKASHVPLDVQQPVEHVLESNEHWPIVLSQSPFVQDVHAAPPDPHKDVDSEANGTHVLPLQQPVGHELELQTQCPLVVLHTCPEAQDPHAPPPVPHEMLVSDAYGSHVPVDVQQPFGHEVELHTHCPLPLHTWPDAHDAQAAPPAPHEELDSLESDSHVLPPLQHPEQAFPPHEHAPPEHACPEEQALQALPPAPQSAPDWEAKRTHELPLQQPVGQELASQTHSPVVLSHSCPDVHAAHAAPPAPHDAVDSEPYVSHVPVEPPLQQPPAQVVALHAQVPEVVSQTPFVQPVHAAPPVPHWVADWEA